MTMDELHVDPGRFLQETVREFCQNSSSNSLKNADNERAYDEPLVGFSSGADPLYREIATSIGPPSQTPAEIFKATFPDLEIEPDELTIISWILPQTRRTCLDNRNEAIYPSERWIPGQTFWTKGIFGPC